MSSKLRYVEISKRNPVTRILVGAGNTCYSSRVCSEVCIVIERAGSKKCAPKMTYDDCNNTCAPVCETLVARICAEEVDANGYAVFHWPTWLMEQKEGWYSGTVVSGCSKCGEFPVRIGPRCNVIKVETEIMGPDSACIVTCDDDPCVTDICPPKQSNPAEIYTPTYTITFKESDPDAVPVGLIGGKGTLMNRKDPDEPCVP